MQKAPCKKQGALILFKSVVDNFFNGFDNFVKLNFHADFFISCNDFANAFLEISGAYDYSDGYAEKVSVGEHSAGTDVSVIIDNFHSVVEHF